MDECPNCGARLAGDPSWCPRCLSRLDRAAPARQFAAAWSAIQATPATPAPPTETVSRPPSGYTPYTPPPPPVANPVVAAPANGATTAKNRIPRTVVLAILMGVALQIVAFALVRGLHMAPATGVMLGLGLTVVFYLLVLSLVQGRLMDSNVRPIWHLGPPGSGVAVGVTVGACTSLGVVGLLSLAAGHVSSDSSAMTAIAQGGFLRIGMLVLVTVVAAPLVEELLFRGLLAESLRSRGTKPAIWLSALAFALWHLRISAIWYYLLMGALFGLLYWKRGLVCSMAAHATFNGLLAVIAFLALSAPAHTVTAAGVSLSAPASWRQVGSTDNATEFELRSLSGAQVFVQRLSIPYAVDPNALTSRLNTAPALAPGVTVKAGSVHAVQYPAGAGAEAEVDDNGHEADAVVITSTKGAVIFELVTGGNVNARPQFESMLKSLQIS